MAMDSFFFFFFSFKCVQKFKDPARMVPSDIKQESWDTVKVGAAIFFKDISEVIETWQQYVQNRTERKRNSLSMVWKVSAELSVTRLPGYQVGCVRWCKEAFSYYLINIFGEVVENTYKAKRLCISLLKYLWGFWDWPVQKPWTVITVYWTGKGKYMDNEYFISELENFGNDIYYQK